MMKLGFLASNNGSSFRAVLAAIESRTLAAEARLVISNRKGAPALDFARERRIATAFIPTVSDPDAADERVAHALKAAGADLVILSGYLRKLGPRTLAAFNGRILNIHPALLPRHGGQGMYGRRVHEAVLASNEALTGATVHLVDEEYDHGAIVAQTEVPVLPGDSAESLEARVMAAEPALFVATLQGLVAGSLSLTHRPVKGGFSP
jgi:phosphoribosylglycinamide formyltransferase 1